MNQLLTTLTGTDVEELFVNPAAFTLGDIIGIAKLLKKSPTEVFEMILNEFPAEEISYLEQ